MSTCLTIESWRWAGVPFYLRAGKNMPGTATEAVIELRRPPRLLFAGQRRRRARAANLVRFRLGHSDGVTLSVQAKAPGARTRHPAGRPATSTSSPRSGTAGRRTSGCSTTPWTAGGTGSPARTPSRRSGGSSSRSSTSPDRPVPYYKGTWGPPVAHRARGRLARRVAAPLAGVTRFTASNALAGVSTGAGWGSDSSTPVRPAAGPTAPGPRAGATALPRSTDS